MTHKTNRRQANTEIKQIGRSPYCNTTPTKWRDRLRLNKTGVSLTAPFSRSGRALRSVSQLGDLLSGSGRCRR